MKKDNLRANWQTLEDYLAVKLDCTITSWLKITYKGLKRLMSVFISYLDVTTDLILLGTVWAVLAPGTSYLDNQFAYQVAIILLVSIVIPLANFCHYDCLQPACMPAVPLVHYTLSGVAGP